MSTSGNPLVAALGPAGAASPVRGAVNYIGLAGLVASFFSIICAYSRQLFALSRAGYLPTGNGPSLPNPGGIVTTGFALVVAALALLATFVVDGVAAVCCLAVFCGFLLYFGCYGRHRLISSAPDGQLAG